MWKSENLSFQGFFSELLLRFKCDFRSPPEHSLKFHNKRREIKRTQNAERGKRKEEKKKTTKPNNTWFGGGRPWAICSGWACFGLGDWTTDLQKCLSFWPQPFCDLVSTSMWCEGRVLKPAKCFCCAFPSVNQSQTSLNALNSINQTAWMMVYEWFLEVYVVFLLCVS